MLSFYKHDKQKKEKVKAVEGLEKEYQTNKKENNRIIEVERWYSS